MSIICTDPTARNFNADDDLPCIYTIRKNGTCHVFTQVTTEAVEKDRSYTISFDKGAENWVFFHSYIPDFYVHDRDKLLALKDSKLYGFNEGKRGQYFSSTPDPFMIDLVFSGRDAILNTIEWVSSLLDKDGIYKEFVTFTHIMAWDSVQCTGLIPLQDVIKSPQVNNHRKTMSTFTFNQIRDVVVNRSAEFLSDVFSRYQFNITPEDVAWYEKGLLKDNYFVIRLMHDNGAEVEARENEQVLLHDININTNLSDR